MSLDQRIRDAERRLFASEELQPEETFTKVAHPGGGIPGGHGRWLESPELCAELVIGHLTATGTARRPGASSTRQLRA